MTALALAALIVVPLAVALAWVYLLSSEIAE